MKSTWSRAASAWLIRWLLVPISPRAVVHRLVVAMDSPFSAGRLRMGVTLVVLVILVSRQFAGDVSQLCAALTPSVLEVKPQGPPAAGLVETASVFPALPRPLALDLDTLETLCSNLGISLARATYLGSDPLLAHAPVPRLELVGERLAQENGGVLPESAGWAVVEYHDRPGLQAGSTRGQRSIHLEASLSRGRAGPPVRTATLNRGGMALERLARLCRRRPIGLVRQRVTGKRAALSVVDGQRPGGLWEYAVELVGRVTLEGLSGLVDDLDALGGLTYVRHLDIRARDGDFYTVEIELMLICFDEAGSSKVSEGRGTNHR